MVATRPVIGERLPGDGESSPSGDLQQPPQLGIAAAVGVVVAVVVLFAVGFGLVRQSRSVRSDNAKAFCSMFQIPPTGQIERLRKHQLVGDPAAQQAQRRLVVRTMKLGVAAHAPARLQGAVGNYLAALDAVGGDVNAELTPSQLKSVDQLDLYVAHGCPR